jgi:hypothetical protein
MQVSLNLFGIWSLCQKEGRYGVNDGIFKSGKPAGTIVFICRAIIQAVRPQILITEVRVQLLCSP